MNIIKEKIIDGKLAQLILDDDNITVKVVYADVCIDESAGGTWENIKDEDWVKDAFIDFAVKEVRGNIDDNEFLDMINELD